MATNLIDGMTNEILRVTKIRDAYLDLPGGVGKPAAFLMDEAINKAKKAQATGDILEMIPALKELQDFEM